MPSKKKGTVQALAEDKKMTKALENLQKDLTNGIKEFLEKNPEKSIEDVIGAVKVRAMEKLQENEEEEETEEESEEETSTEKPTEGEKETPTEGESTEKDAEGKVLKELSDAQDLLEKAKIESVEKDGIIENTQKSYDELSKKFDVTQKELDEIKDVKAHKRIEELAAKEVAIGSHTDKEKRVSELKSFSEKTLEQLEKVVDRLIERKKDEPVSNTKRSEELLENENAYNIKIDGDRVWASDRTTKLPSEIK